MKLPAGVVRLRCRSTSAPLENAFRIASLGPSQAWRTHSDWPRVQRSLPRGPADSPTPAGANPAPILRSVMPTAFGAMRSWPRTTTSVICEASSVAPTTGSDPFAASRIDFDAAAERLDQDCSAASRTAIGRPFDHGVLEARAACPLALAIAKGSAHDQRIVWD